MLDNRKQFYINFIRTSESLSVILASYISLKYFSSRDLLLNIGQTTYIDTGIMLCGVFTLGILICIHLFLFDYYYSQKHQFFLPNLKEQSIKLCYTLILDIFFILIVQIFTTFNVLENGFYVSYILLSLIFNIILRYLCYKVIKEYISYKNNLLNILVVGTNRRATEFYEYITTNSFLGYNILGFLDDGNHSDLKLTMLGDLGDLPKIIRDNVVDSLVVCLPIRSYYDQIAEIINVAETQGISIHYMNSLFEPKHSYLKPSSCGDVSCLLMHSSPISDWRLLLKRAFDIVGASALLLLGSPLMLGLALAIKLNDGGPVFYRQERVGYYKRTFKVIKFRSMQMGAEDIQVSFESQNEMDGPVFKIRNDPRVTAPGRFIRKYGLDELPQLFNVLKGDMSLVGPRPLAIRDYTGFSEDWLRRRFSVRPGITCYWQCMKDRNCLSFRQWMDLDMKYIDNWSLVEDVRICLETLPAILSGTGM